MYKFVDTIEKPGDEEMPAEAMKLNGEYIENLMDARYCTYRTLYVKGREMLSPDLTSYETGVRDGSVLQSKKFPSRTITVGYKLQATSNYWFRIAYNELMKILNVENAKLIFYDEQDKYFTGTPQKLGDVDYGTNFVQGEFDILCNDPFKYSVTEYEVEPTEDEGTTFVVDYGGTYPAHPELEADFYSENECGDDGSSYVGLTGKGDCGYVAWFDADTNIIQLGDPDEGDIETYDKTQTLFSQSWCGVSEWTPALNNIWIKNNGVLSSSAVTQTGTSGFYMADPKRERYYLCAEDYGSAGSTDWYGPTVTRTIPADATGEIGARDFTCRCQLKAGITENGVSQRGCFQMIIGDANGSRLCGFSVFKNSNGKSALLRTYAGFGYDFDRTIDLSFHNLDFGNSQEDYEPYIYPSKECRITKTGGQVDFELGTTVYSCTNPSIQDSVATTVTFVFAAQPGYEPLFMNGVYDCWFKKNNCETWADIPNKFGTNDIVVADCSDGKIYMNDAHMPEYGALGNDWEAFCLVPGYNQIGFTYSSWCEEPPTTKMRYREVYL